MTEEITSVDTAGAEDTVLEGQLQLPSHVQKVFTGTNCYSEAMGFLMWCKPQQVQIETGQLPDGTQACRLTYSRKSLQ